MDKSGPLLLSLGVSGGTLLLRHGPWHSAPGAVPACFCASTEQACSSVELP